MAVGRTLGHPQHRSPGECKDRQMVLDTIEAAR